MKDRLKLKLLQAWDAILWERLLAALWTPVSVWMIAAALVISGLLSDLPDVVRFGALGLLAVACLWSLTPLFKIGFPSGRDALRRIDRESNIAHRAASSSDDALAPELTDPLTARLWEAHKTRQLSLLDRLKAGWPRSDVKRRDPYALRLAACLALVAAVFLHRGDPVSNAMDAVRLADPVAKVVTSVDAWIIPPSYTGKPPLMLTSAAMKDKLAREPALTVPENAVLMARVANGKLPRLAFFAAPVGAEPPKELKDVASTQKLVGANFQGEVKLTRSALVKLFDGERELASWQVVMLPDAPPTVAFDGEPKPTATGALEVGWMAKDDYGVAGITSDISLSDDQDGETGIAGNGVFLFDPPAFAIGLKSANPKDAKGTAANDLAAHPWAGFTIDMKLSARDAAGRAGESEVKTFKLPERSFIKPVARALVEQRKGLIMDPDDTADVQSMLNALLIYPKDLFDSSGAHLGIRTISSGLARANSREDIEAAIDGLWKLALLIEEGDLSDAKAELEAVRKELERALREGASPEKIQELMKKMREAMNKYMDSMQREAGKRQQQNGNEQERRQAGKTVTPEDLQKMLDRIEELSKNGANEAAQELLSQLDQILKNMQPGNEQAQQQQNGEMSQMLDELSEMMRRQQQLMDDTQRMPEPGPGEPNGEMGEQPEGMEPGSRGQRPSPGDLSAQQEALGRMLQEMMDQMGKNGMQPPPSLGEAGKSMDGAAGALGKGEKGKALGDQGDALAKLREGAQNMARQMAQQGTGNQGAEGRHGEGRGDDRDPLGRPMPTQGEDMGPEKNMLPGEAALRRAREILDMLRSRANEPDRPKLERDYIDRLLRGLY